MSEARCVHVETLVGQPVTVRLWEDRTRGSRWNPIYDMAVLRCIGDDYERTRNIRVDDVGMRQFEFLALSPGLHEVTFELRYGWKFSAENRLVYLFHTSPAPSGLGTP